MENTASVPALPASQDLQSPDQARAKRRVPGTRHYLKRIVRLDGDSNLSVNMDFLKAQLKRFYQYSKTLVPSCLLTLKSKWTLSSSIGRQAIFSVKDAEERLVAARFRVGSSHQIVVVGSASRFGALGRRTMILKPTREAIEPVQRDGRTWRQDIWRVWDPVSDQVTDNDSWPSIVRLLEVETSSGTRATNVDGLTQAEEPSHTAPGINRIERFSTFGRREDDNLGSSSGDDSDIPLYQRHQRPAKRITSHDSDEDIPLCRRIRYGEAGPVHRDSNRSFVSPDCDQKPILVKGQSLGAVSIVSSSGDNKDYSYWQICGLVDGIP